MKSFISLLLLFKVFSVYGKSPDTLGSSLHLLRQNDLNYTDAVNHASTILLEPKPFEEALASCTQLNEGLLDINVAPKFSEDLISLLSYIVFNKKYPADQSFWIQSKDTKHPQTIQLINGKIHQNSLAGNKNARLPALCSQSAPFQPAGDSDKDGKWQVNTTAQGKTFTGFRDQLSFRFLGIPYANPPARWEYSTIYNNPHVDTFDATNFGSQCVQTGSGPFSEDCLFLNIFTPFLPVSKPVAPTSQLKPVLFWIHGGAFTGGAGSDSIYDGGSLASRGDIVLVTINYRLSTLGFLSLNNDIVKGNYGLADQIVALEWVQQNIAAFGGDPNKVTIFGQSAGAASVRALLASPKAIGKFSAAISQSNLAGADYATTYSLYYTPAEEVEVVGNQIVELMNCTDSNAQNVVACLRAVSPSALVDVPNPARFLVVDGEFLVSNGLKLDGSGPVSHVPTMWGHMRFDGASFIGYPGAGEDLVAALQPIIGNQSLSAVQSGLFPVPSGPNSTLNIFNVTARIATDVEFRCLDQATAVAAVRNKVFPSVFFYSFYRSYQFPGSGPINSVCDAPETASHPSGDTSLPYFQCHSGELYYVFGYLGQSNLPIRDDVDILFSQVVLDRWVAFASTHNPNPNPELLSARGYKVTLAEMQESGLWKEVTSSNPTLRKMDYPSVQQPFEEVDECEFLGFPIDFYL